MIDLITASILSKKLAAGLDALVLDVKVGTGAFMATLDDALALAASLTQVANGAGCRTRALVTDMNEPLADRRRQRARDGERRALPHAATSSTAGSGT